MDSDWAVATSMGITPYVVPRLPMLAEAFMVRLAETAATARDTARTENRGEGTIDTLRSLVIVVFKPDTLRHRGPRVRSEEHTSELQSRPHLVCRLLLEKKKR